MQRFAGSREHCDARWVKPVITLKVKQLAFGSGLLRHTTVRELGDDVAIAK